MECFLILRKQALWDGTERVHKESEGKQNSENSGNKDGNGNLSNREHVPCTETKSKIETWSQVQQGAWGEWGSDSR